MVRPLKWLPVRRLELGLTTLFVLGLLLVVRWTRDQQPGPAVALVTLEVLLPLAVGVTAAGLLAGDPALDLLLSVPQPVTCTLAERLAVVLGWGGLLGLVVQALIGAWEIPLPVQGLSRVWIWVAPALLLTGVATASALVRGHWMDGLMAVMGALGWALLAMPYVGAACPEGPAARCALALATPAMTLLRPTDPLWPLNRLIWSVIGLLLLATSLALAGCEERLVEAARAREDT
jgi:hypothetical protein